MNTLTQTTHEPRIDFFAAAPEISGKLSELSGMIRKSGLGNTLLDLVNLRASQINGCAFCVDMHSKEATIHGERELRLHHLTVWRESSLYTARERAAMEWTEAVTRLADNNHAVPDETYLEARTHFSDAELATLTFAVAVINSWNRLAVTFRKTPGSADAFYGLDKAGLN
jgi:AhpD family alkylhydroperoxidase